MMNLLISVSVLDGERHYDGNGIAQEHNTVTPAPTDLKPGVGLAN